MIDSKIRATEGTMMATTVERTGSRTGNRAQVLRSAITAGGFGRPLTSTECRALRTLGWSVSERYIVVRQVSDISNLGIVYRPSSGGGYDHAGIYVTTRDA